jgi:hypothetical protein
MTKYHRIVNLTKWEYIDGNDFGQGLELAPLLDNHRGVMGATMLLLSDRWKGDIVTIADDYLSSSGRTELIRIIPQLATSRAKSLFEFGQGFVHVEQYVKELSISQWNLDLIRYFGQEQTIFPNLENPHQSHVLYNLSKDEYVDPYQLGDPGNIIHFICAGGNGGMLSALTYLLRLHQNFSDHPSWAKDSVAVIDREQVPNHATNITRAIRHHLISPTVLYKTAPTGQVIRSRQKYDEEGNLVTDLRKTRNEKLGVSLIDADFSWEEYA